MSDLVLHDVADGLATITINRPEKRNAMDQATREALRSAFTTADDDNSVRVIILRGAGSAFSAGGDLEFYKELDLVEGLKFMRKHGEGLYTLVERVSKPTIAAVDGYALGGGTEISLACDIRLASTEARFGTTESRVGLYPAGGGATRLIRIVGLGRAKEFVYTGKIIGPEEAEDIGLVNHVYDADAFDEEVQDFAEMLASRAPLAIQLAKESMNRGLNMEAGYGIDRVSGGFLFGTADQKEGAAAFLEDRDPNYQGK